MMIALRLVHILCGIFWVGSAIAASMFIVPSVFAIGPAGGQFMEQFVGIRKYPVWAAVTGVLTILSGLGMFWYNTSVSNGAFPHSAPGMTYSIAAVFAIVGAVVGSAVTGRTAGKLQLVAARASSAGGPPSAEMMSEMAALRAKLHNSSLFATGLIVLTAAMMAVARYL